MSLADFLERVFTPARHAERRRSGPLVEETAQALGVELPREKAGIRNMVQDAAEELQTPSGIILPSFESASNNRRAAHA